MRPWRQKARNRLQDAAAMTTSGTDVSQRTPVALSAPAARHLLRLRENFIEGMWKGLLLIALIGMPVSVSRALHTGWITTYTIHVALAAGIVLFYVLMKRFSLDVKSAALIAALWAIGLPGLFTMGFPAASIWWLVLSCLVAGTVYSFRAGVALGAATLLVIAVAAFGFISGRLTLALDPNEYLRQPMAWAALLLVTGTFTFLVLRSMWLYNSSLVELLRRISEQRDTIERLSMHDQLTGLPLAELADDRVGMAIHAAKRSGTKVALLFIDLDDFKAVNDTYGHETGNVVLRQAAHRIRAAIRAEDTVARLSGDELLAVIVDLKERAPAGLVADKIIAAASTPITVHGNLITVGASVGIAIYPDDGTDGQSLRNLADTAMYVAKKSGKNRYSFAPGPELSPVLAD
jgi:diguanylate cyclase (GGDEF)-like protein